MELTAGLCGIFWGLEELVFVGIAYWLKEWRMICIVIGAYQLFLCFLYFFLDETPRFLLSRKKEKKFKEVLRKIAKINKKTLPDDFDNFVLTGEDMPYIQNEAHYENRNLDIPAGSLLNEST